MQHHSDSHRSASSLVRTCLEYSAQYSGHLSIPQCTGIHQSPSHIRLRSHTCSSARSLYRSFLVDKLQHHHHHHHHRHRHQCQCQCQRKFIQHINVKPLMRCMRQYEANINVFKCCLNLSLPTPESRNSLAKNSTPTDQPQRKLVCDSLRYIKPVYLGVQEPRQASVKLVCTAADHPSCVVATCRSLLWEHLLGQRCSSRRVWPASRCRVNDENAEAGVPMFFN